MTIYAVHIIKWPKFVALVIGILANIIIMTFRRMVVATKSTNWFKLAHFGNVISPFLTIETLNQFNFIDFRYHFEMDVRYVSSIFDSNIIFGFRLEKQY